MRTVIITLQQRAVIVDNDLEKSIITQKKKNIFVTYFPSTAVEKANKIKTMHSGSRLFK